MRSHPCGDFQEAVKGELVWGKLCGIGFRSGKQWGAYLYKRKQPNPYRCNSVNRLRVDGEEKKENLSLNKNILFDIALECK